MKNILITGGAGFIGSNLALKLINKGYSITVLDNLSKQIHGDSPEFTSYLYQTIKDKVKFIKGSVTDRDGWIKALDGNEIVVHFAAETGTGQSMYEIQKYVDVNINGTALLLDILANNKHQVKKVIVASSRSIYGEGKYRSQSNGIVYPNHRLAEDMDRGDFSVKYPGCNDELELLPTDEDSKLHPSSVYGITKLNQEQLIMTVCPTLGINAVAFRYQNVYGPGQSLKNPYTGILSIFSTQIRNNNPINIFEDGEESRDFVFIDDVVDATILGIELDSANNNIFNVGTGNSVNVVTVANTLCSSFGIKAQININGSYRLGDIRHNKADLTKIRNLLGFNPAVSFKSGIERFVEWVKRQDIEKDNYDQSILEMKNRGLYK
jgi:dTDP-L-rhamnose 4-epimerase